jgi:hypothetical protein
VILLRKFMSFFSILSISYFSNLRHLMLYTSVCVATTEYSIFHKVCNFWEHNIVCEWVSSLQHGLYPGSQ